MAKPNFTAALIGELRNRVVEHNRSGAPEVKLGKLRALYASNFRGDNPGAAAMEKVDGYLSDLAKATFDEGEHPRGEDGKFAAGGGKAAAPRAKLATMGMPLPESRKDHEALAASNAGYAAMQSATIPETRGATTGRIVRDVGASLAGLAVAGSLARGKPNGLVGHFLRFKGQSLGLLAGAVTGVAVNHSLEHARNALHRIPRFAETSGAKSARWAAATRRTVVIGNAGAKAGRFFGDQTFRATSSGVRGIVNAAGSAAKTRLGAALYRAEAVGLVGVPIGLGINSSIQGTVVDPERIGGIYDSYSHRSILKMAGSDEIGTARDALLKMVREGADEDALLKAVPRLPGGYSVAGRAVLSGLAGLAGGLAGAAVGHGAEAAVIHASNTRGNPYHDSHGRFTSSTGATGGGMATGALIGGALAALAAHRSMTNHNIGMLRAAAQKARSVYLNEIAEIDKPASVGEVADLLAARSNAINADVAKHKAVVAARESIKRYGTSSDLHFKATIVRQANERFANNAAFLDDFEMPKKEAGKTEWRRIGDLKAKYPSLDGKREQYVATQIKNFIETAKPFEFERAIKNISPESQATLRHFFEKRGAWAADVDKQLLAHQTAISDTDAMLTKAAEDLTKARSEHIDAKAVVDRNVNDADALQTATANYAKTGKAVKEAEKAHQKLLDQQEKLRTGGPSVVSPVDGKPIAPPTQMDLDVAIKGAEDKVHGEVAAKYDRLVEAARMKQRGLAAERANRAMAALAVAGDAHGLPASAKRQGAVVARLHRQIGAIKRDLADATKIRDTAAASLKSIGSKATADERDQLKRAVANASARVSDISTRLAVARAHRGMLSTNFEKHLKDRANGGFRLLPDHLREDLIADLDRATSGMRGAANNFLQNPVMQNLLRFAGETRDGVVDAGTKATHALFYQRQPDGTYDLNWVKAATNVGVAASALEGAREVYGYGRDMLTGDEHARAKAKFPSHLIEWDINPTTGAAYAALVVPHPKEEGEKVVLYGERQKSFEDPPKPIYAGGRISSVKGQFQNGKWANQTSDSGEAFGRNDSGDAHGLSGDAKKKLNDHIEKLRSNEAILKADITPNGPSVMYRSPTDADGNQTVPAFLDYMRDRHLNKGELDQSGYWQALSAMSSKQAAILTPKQAYTILTNRRIDGGEGKNQNGIFAPVKGWASTDEDIVAASLRAEADRAMKMNPEPAQKANLQRAVQLVGIAKGIDKNTLLQIQQRIAGAGQQGNQQANQQGGQKKPDDGPSVKTGADKPTGMPPGWAKDELRNMSFGDARTLARQLKLYHAGAQDDLANTIEVLARKVHETHGLPMADSVKAASSAIWDSAGNSFEERENAADDLRSGHWQDNNELYNKLDEHARKLKAARANMDKLASLDDFDALTKAFGQFDSSKHPRMQGGQHGGGEFSSGDAGGAGSSGADASPSAGAAPAVQSASGAGLRVPRVRGSSSPELSVFHPLRVAPELAENMGFSVGMQIAHKYIPGRKAASDYMTKALGAKAQGEAEWRSWVAGNAASEAASGAERSASAAEAAVGRGLIQKFLPGVVGVAAGAVKGIAYLAVPEVGAIVARTATDAALESAYGLAGEKMPENAEKSQPLGRALLGMAGSFVGNGVGTTLAGGATFGVGSIVGAAAGAYAGEAAGRQIYDFFTGYGAAGQRAMSRFMQPQARA